MRRGCGQRWGGPLHAGGPDAGALYARGVFRLRRDLPDARSACTSGIGAACDPSGRSPRHRAGVAALPMHWESLRFPATSASTTPSTLRTSLSTGRHSCARSTTTSRSCSAAASLVQRLPEPGKHLAAGARDRGASRCPRYARRLLRVGGRPHAALLRLQHARSRRALRSDPAHVPAAGCAGACGIRPAVRRHARACHRDGGGDRALRPDVVRANPPRAGRCAPSIRRSSIARVSLTATWCSSKSARTATWTRARVRSPDDAVRRALRGPAAGRRRPAVLQPDDRRLGVEHLPRAGRGRRDVRRAADRSDAARSRSSPKCGGGASDICSCGPSTTRDYLARSGHFVERWRGGRWSHFELADADLRSVVTTSGSGALRNLDFLGGEVALVDASAGETDRRAGKLLPGVARVPGGTGRAAVFRERATRLSSATGWHVRCAVQVSALRLAHVDCDYVDYDRHDLSAGLAWQSPELKLGPTYEGRCRNM